MRFFEGEIDSIITENDIEEMSLVQEEEIIDIDLYMGSKYTPWEQVDEEMLPTPEKMGYEQEEDDVQELNFG